MKDSLTKSKEDEIQSISTDQVNQQPQTSGLEDLSPEAVSMREFQSQVDGSEEMQGLSKYQDTISGGTDKKSKTKKPNKTGIPNELKASIEQLSGYSLDDVKVHYNSDKPAQIGAYAYAEGNNIYVGPGQEKHLAHEIWHVIQQKGGKVKGDTKVDDSGTLANTENSLEDEATKMGDKATKTKTTEEETDLKTATASGPIQMLSQPNQHIISAGDEEVNGSSEQQDKQIEALLADAQKALGPFTQVFDKLKVDTGASTKKIDQQKKVKYKADHPKVQDGTVKEDDIMYHQNTEHPVMETQNLKATSMGKLKGKDRIKQKMNTKYAGAGKHAVNEINDVVRGTLAFENFGEMLTALNVIEALAGTAGGFDGFTYEIARAKQIYTPVSALLYGDVKLNLKVMSSSDYTGDAFDHNCELQLNTIEMLEGKGTSAGHGAYVKWRNLDEEHWKKEGSALPVKIKDMTDEPGTKYKSRARLAVVASQDAYKKADIARKADSDFTGVVDKVEELKGNTLDENAAYFTEQTFEQVEAAYNAKYADFLRQNKG
jgi:hypothetical protein